MPLRLLVRAPALTAPRTLPRSLRRTRDRFPHGRVGLDVAHVVVVHHAEVAGAECLGHGERHLGFGLDDIVAGAIASQSVLGYFAALYGRVTRKVASGIEAGQFEDGERMAELVVVFADRYLEAYRAYRRGDVVPESWRAAFAAEARPARLPCSSLSTSLPAS